MRVNLRCDAYDLPLVAWVRKMAFGDCIGRIAKEKDAVGETLVLDLKYCELPCGTGIREADRGQIADGSHCLKNC